MHLRVHNTNDEPVTITYLAVLEPDEVRDFDEEEVERYMHASGLLPLPDNMPSGLDVTVVVGDEKEGKG
jgi:hypothetical protein